MENKELLTFLHDKIDKISEYLEDGTMGIYNMIDELNHILEKKAEIQKEIEEITTLLKGDLDV